MTLLIAVCIDCSNPRRLAHWWAPLLGYEVRRRTDEDTVIALDPQDEQGPTVWFNEVPEEKIVKNRVHLDVYGDVHEIVESGATLLYGTGELPGTHWAVLADPEGNEFCVFAPEQ